jgi:hypothetical protein
MCGHVDPDSLNLRKIGAIVNSHGRMWTDMDIQEAMLIVGFSASFFVVGFNAGWFIAHWFLARKAKREK